MTKIAIVGAGSVGATIAYSCMIRGVAKHVALYDINRRKVDAQVLDLNHGLQFTPMAHIEGSDDIGIIGDSQIVVITAGAKQKQGQSRMDLAGANTQILRKLIPRVLHITPGAKLLVVSNPVDFLTYVALKLSGKPSRQVFGSGTVLDSSRFRYLIAQRCSVAVQNVHAYIAGEHGDNEIPLGSSAAIGCVPLHEWAVPGHGRLTVRDRTEIFQNVKNATDQIISGKGATDYAIGLAATRILEAIVRNENLILPVSALLEDYHGISDVCLSIPSIVNHHGVEVPINIPLNDAELAALRRGAQDVRKMLRELGF